MLIFSLRRLVLKRRFYLLKLFTCQLFLVWHLFFDPSGPSAVFCFQSGSFTVWNDEDFHEHHPLKTLCCRGFNAHKGRLPPIAIAQVWFEKGIWSWEYANNGVNICQFTILSLYPPPTHKPWQVEQTCKSYWATGEQCCGGTVGALGKFLWMSQKSHLVFGSMIVVPLFIWVVVSIRLNPSTTRYIFSI